MAEISTRTEQELDVVFNDVFDHYYGQLVVFAAKMIKNQMVAEEIVQDIFVGFWFKKRDMVIRSSVKSYLYKSVYNGCIDFLRKEVSENKRKEEYAVSVEKLIDFQDLVEETQLKERIEQTIQELPLQCKKIFLMSREEGFSNKEIAEHLSLSVKTVENQMGKALKHFRKKMPDLLLFIVQIISCIK